MNTPVKFIPLPTPPADKNAPTCPKCHGRGFLVEPLFTFLSPRATKIDFSICNCVLEVNKQLYFQNIMQLHDKGMISTETLLKEMKVTYPTLS